MWRGRYSKAACYRVARLHIAFFSATAPITTRAEARALAARYVAQLNQQLPATARICWLVAEPVEYARYRYVACRYEHLVPTDPADALAGAPAYLLWKHSQLLIFLLWAD